MDNPKVSVLIPMYNRKQYAESCINSVLKQTFTDFEIVIRDDCSTDGVFEFVQEKYSDQISSGKIRLLKNSENVGEGINMNRIFRDARGKYLLVVHNDDIILSNALDSLHTIAERYNADVVHSAIILETQADGIIGEGTQLKIKPIDNPPTEEITLVPNDPISRFNDWINNRIFQDTQYNLFRRDFIFENELIYDTQEAEALIFSLQWMMLAKVLVKTPEIFYIRRENPYNQSNENSDAAGKIEKFISAKIEQSRDLNKLFGKIPLFKNNEGIQYMIKAHIFKMRTQFFILRPNFYKDGITSDIYQATAKAFKKYFGDDYFYPMFLFNLYPVIFYNKRVDIVLPPH